MRFGVALSQTTGNCLCQTHSHLLKYSDWFLGTGKRLGRSVREEEEEEDSSAVMNASALITILPEEKSEKQHRDTQKRA